MSKRLNLKQYFTTYDSDRVDAALVTLNKNYDGFNHFDFIYLFKGLYWNLIIFSLSKHFKKV